jgi:hypothetical protein
MLHRHHAHAGGIAVLAPGLILLAADFFTFSLPASGAAVGGLVLFLIGGAVAWVGNVLTFAVGTFKLYSRYKNPLYMAVGILFAADATLLLIASSGVLTIVGYVLMYVALKHTLFSS